MRSLNVCMEDKSCPANCVTARLDVAQEYAVPNAIKEVDWSINKPVLVALTHAWEKGMGL